MTANPYAAPTDPLAPYSAVLVVSFGGPRSPEEVMPFLRRVSHGRIPEERLADQPSVLQECDRGRPFSEKA